MYQNFTTNNSPALIIFLIDSGRSMEKPLGHHTRLAAAKECLKAVITEMVWRSLKQARILPRYRLGIVGYSDKVYDLSNGTRSIDLIAQKGIPDLRVLSKESDVLKGFKYVKELLDHEIGSISDNSPAPLIIHITDGEFTSKEDPEPMLREIQNMEVADGKVLVANQFVSDELKVSVEDATTWPGYKAGDEVGSPYGNRLLSFSSPLPETYREKMLNYGYSIEPETMMMYPGIKPEFIQMAFAMPVVS